jgi:DNA-binding XRE family transcriptional regulator
VKPIELKKWRRQHTYTQKELGKKLGVTKTCVYRWEAGYRHIPPFLHLALECLDKKGGKIKSKGKKTKRERRKGEKKNSSNTGLVHQETTKKRKGIQRVT